ncbi:hypothetical protein ANOM_004301 [Aspergillus nomiae NRRL 13137]|uniref:Uncharacterized protein n=1 Tax=Aspergillus nomiae NRRL (strain ATCC 15546 / NRRL 13137 / CBS 260.88 / M93) TaxID=1509407 RepID=A0A0L1J9J3_ASPN3|nr:uncharacterized protein ANOM_004301 [Aspergillus nomiae NRRL 13137]KNG88431.1 hypothetical protein ANOM_004301 [Aspergillus nomiae NRRL 13137]
MTLLYIRGLAPYQPGDNGTDVIINEVHFNRTALDTYNYRLYTNGTLSNGTNCFLAFQRFRPHMFDENGTFINGTSCYAPINAIGQHASLGLAYALMFVITIFLSLRNLRKHSRSYLPHDRRWNIVSRRLKWCWLIFVAVCGAISCFMSIDVDRNYLQSAPLILQSVFYTLLTPGLMAAVWEAVRHWARWQTRQIHDRDPYAFTKASTRSWQETLLPILFYVLALLNFILTVPRSWSAIELQRSEEQQTLTPAQWQQTPAGAIYRYKPRPSSLVGQLLFYLNAAPSQFLLAIAILGIKIGYAIASAFDWTLSPLKYDVQSAWIYGLGYTPALLIILLFNICGYCELNEDKALIAQRGELESALANDEGIGQRNPPWWKKQRLRSFAREITGRGSPIDRDREDMARYVEMGIIKPQEQSGDRVMGVSEVNKEEPGVTTRQATSTTFEDDGSESPLDHIEYVVQPERSASPQPIPGGRNI